MIKKIFGPIGERENINSFIHFKVFHLLVLSFDLKYNFNETKSKKEHSKKKLTQTKIYYFLFFGGDKPPN